MKTAADTPRLVADSVRLGKPIIVVAINYRLNMFAFGNGKGERNLALQDQQCAIEWIRKHIEDFGGDKVCKGYQEAKWPRADIQRLRSH